MSDNFSLLIEAVINPNTNNSLKDEGRIVSILRNGENLEVVYKRDEINSEVKRKIEDSIYKVLEGSIDEDNIFIKTVSDHKVEEVQKSEPVEKKANLQAGHGPTGQAKKRVPGVSKVIAISSGKGGVGKSTLTVNIALSLVKQGKKVGIIDADIYGPSIPMLLGEREAKPASNESNKIIPVKAWGLSFISFGLFVKENEPVIWRGPMLGGVLNQFLFDVDWGDLDYLILDLPPGTGDMQLSMAQATEIDGAVVVSTPQDVALLDSKKGLEMFNKINIPIIGMVENMSSFICDSCDKEHFIFGKDGVKEAADHLKVEYLGGVPIDTALRESSDLGKPYVTQKENEKSKVYESFNKVALNIDSYFNKDKKKGFLGKLFN